MAVRVQVPLAVLKKILCIRLRMCNIFCTFAPKFVKENLCVIHLVYHSSKRNAEIGFYH